MHSDQQFETVASVAASLGFERGGAASDPSETLEFAWIRPDQLVIDRSYQRRVSNSGKARIKRALREFDWCRFGAITVVPVGDDQFAVIDGQHRGVIAFAAGAAVVPAIVFKADIAEQAVAFVGVNVNRTSVASIDKFRARVAAGDEAAVTVHEILTELEISTDVAAGCALASNQTRAVSKLEKLVKIIGRGLTFTTLEMLVDAQPGQKNLLTAFAIEATAGAVAKVVDMEADLDRLERVLTDTDFETLKSDCAQLTKLQGGQTGRHGVAMLLRAYNKGLRGKVAA